MDNDNLIGLYFHNFKDNGDIKNQGQVVSSPEPGWYLLQLYNFIDGMASSLILRHIDNLEDYRFYEAACHMRETHEDEQRRPKRKSLEEKQDILCWIREKGRTVTVRDLVMTKKVKNAEEARILFDDLASAGYGSIEHPRRNQTIFTLRA